MCLPSNPRESDPADAKLPGEEGKVGCSAFPLRRYPLMLKAPAQRVTIGWAGDARQEREPDSPW